MTRKRFIWKYRATPIYNDAGVVVGYKTHKIKAEQIQLASGWQWTGKELPETRADT